MCTIMAEERSWFVCLRSITRQLGATCESSESGNQEQEKSRPVDQTAFGKSRLFSMNLLYLVFFISHIVSISVNVDSLRKRKETKVASRKGRDLLTHRSLKLMKRAASEQLPLA